ncbi:MAG TPA: lipopolysaccharide kinase InaA family protein [Verrucomicrobiota bacterium]|nr:lipopolysaccharide kinase InaA family protein [Verrucomicrobiota bacterium]HNU50695.1 lipopolysaccharide kinase InaA family protein [Verrucomicrobiota bacterium]
MSGERQERRVGTWRWELEPGFEPLLAAVLDSPGTMVKRIPDREVTRHQVDGRTFYLKCYRHGVHPWRALKYLVKAPRSRLEWELAPELVQRGFAVVPHRAHGERWTARGLGETRLITEGPPGFEPLSGCPALGTPEVQTVLGQFVRELHAAHVRHRDLRVENLLYHPATLDLCLVDLDNIEIGPPLTRAQRLDDLVMLRRRLELTPAFYAAYGGAWEQFAPEITRRARDRVRASAARRLWYCFSGGYSFATGKWGGLTWYYREALLTPALEAMMRDPDGFLESGIRLFKPGRSSTVGCAHGLVLKRYNLHRRRGILADLFRTARGCRAFQRAWHLELLQVPTALPVAAACRRRFGLARESYFVMREIPGAVSLLAWPSGDRTLVQRLASLLAQMHNDGFRHRDLKATNIILDAGGRPHFIDLDGLKHVGRVRRSRAVSDLARLFHGLGQHAAPVSRTQRARFLQRYCRDRDQEDWRPWWRAIDAAAAVLAARQARQARKRPPPPPVTRRASAIADTGPRRESGV